jgi:acyl-CoA thioester hydrolase
MHDPLLADFPVVIEQVVAWGEMDAYRHVNNVVYFRYFENARIAYVERLGWPALQQTSGVGPILASIQARYRRPFVFPDTLLVAARVTQVGDDRFTVTHRIVSRAQNALTTEGEGVVVTYDYAANQKVPLPAELRRRIAELESGPSSS